MKNYPFLLIIAVIAAAACKKNKNCEGVPGHIYVHGITINPSSDTVKGFNSRYTHTLKLLPIITSENGGRDGNCPTYVAPTEKTERIDTSNIVLHCSKNLKFNGLTVAAGENMLDRGDVFQIDVYIDRDPTKPENQFFSSGAVLIQTDSLQSGPHTFYVSGTTTIGNSFMDSVTVIYQ